jgi:hypothetical protein
MAKGTSDKLKQQVYERDGGCVVCNAWEGKAHHIKYKSSGGKDELDNLVYLCNIHHHLIHHGSLRKFIDEFIEWWGLKKTVMYLLRGIIK